MKDALGRVPIPIGMAIVKFAGSGPGVSKTEEFYVYGTERIAMIVPNTLGTTPSRIQYNEATYFLTDHLGNTRVAYMPTTTTNHDVYIINAVEEFAFANEDEMATNVRAKAMRYYPYGKVLREYDNGAGDRYLTTQHERDRETGLDYRGARYYDSDVARFLSLDPLAAKYPSMSPYNYVAGNPIIFIDPDGKDVLPTAKFLASDFNAVLNELRTNNDAFNKYFGVFYTNPNMNITLDLDNTKMTGSGWGKTFNSAEPGTNSKGGTYLKKLNSRVYFREDLEPWTKLSQLGKTALLVHEFLHTYSGRNLTPEEGHVQWEKQISKMVEIMTEYNSDNGWGLDETEIYELSIANVGEKGQIFKNYINKLATENGTDYKTELDSFWGRYTHMTTVIEVGE